MATERPGFGEEQSSKIEYLQERSAEFNEALNGLDLELIKRLIQEEALKSGREKGSNLNFLDQGRIGEIEARGHESSMPISFYNSATNEIEVDFNGLAEQAERQNPFLTKEGLKAYLVAVLIHEELHAATELQALGYVGYQHFRSYQVWNEGVTEKLARELTEKYYKTTADFSQYDQSKSYNYESAVLLLDVVIAKLSAATGFDQQTVWNAIKRGMFENTSLESKELQELFEQTLPADFFKNLRTANPLNETEIHTLIEKMNQGSLEKIVTRLIKFLHFEKPTDSRKAA